MSSKARAPLRGPDLTMDAAAGTAPYRDTNVQGLNPLNYLQRYAGAHTSIIDNPIPATNPAELSSYPNY